MKRSKVGWPRSTFDHRGQADLRQKTINEQIDAFFAKGGEIEHVEIGQTSSSAASKQPVAHIGGWPGATAQVPETEESSK